MLQQLICSTPYTTDSVIHKSKMLVHACTHARTHTHTSFTTTSHVNHNSPRLVGCTLIFFSVCLQGNLLG